LREGHFGKINGHVSDMIKEKRERGTGREKEARRQKTRKVGTMKKARRQKRKTMKMAEEKNENWKKVKTKERRR
jgi:hypothetical protein